MNNSIHTNENIHNALFIPAYYDIIRLWIKPWLSTYPSQFSSQQCCIETSDYAKVIHDHLWWPSRSHKSITSSNSAIITQPMNSVRLGLFGFLAICGPWLMTWKTPNMSIDFTKARLFKKTFPTQSDLESLREFFCQHWKCGSTAFSSPEEWI